MAFCLKIVYGEGFDADFGWRVQQNEEVYVAIFFIFEEELERFFEKTGIP